MEKSQQGMRALLSLNDEEKMVEIADQILKKEISVREVERLAKAAAKEKKNNRKTTLSAGIPFMMK